MLVAAYYSKLLKNFRFGTTNKELFYGVWGVISVAKAKFFLATHYSKLLSIVVTFATS